MKSKKNITETSTAQISVSTKNHHRHPISDHTSQQPTSEAKTRTKTHINSKDFIPTNNNHHQRHTLENTSSISEKDDKIQQQHQEHDIIQRLAMRKFHLPGNNLCQDWIQYIQNNHPLFSIFCYHRLHPLRLGQRLLLLLGSVAFGLIVSSFTTLYFAYARKDMNTALVCVKVLQETDGTLGSVTTNVDASQTNLCRFKISYGMVTLWTLGGLIHTLFDQTLWFMSACCCCLPGAICGNHHRLQKVGSFAVLFIVAIMLAIACNAVIVRAKYEARKAEILAGISSTWKDPDSFSFALGYMVEQMLVWFVYYFIIVSILFSGILACGIPIPILGGRPFEMRLEKRQLEKERRKHQQLSTTTTVSMSTDENDAGTGRITYIRTLSNDQDIELFYDLETAETDSIDTEERVRYDHRRMK